MTASAADDEAPIDWITWLMVHVGLDEFEERPGDEIDPTEEE